MPELPEVETIARGLDSCITGLIINRVECRRRNIMRRGSLSVRRLEDMKIAGVERVGKNIVIRFEPDCALVANLGMTGRLLYSKTGRFPAEYAGRHLHVRFFFANGGELRYHDPRRFGSLLITEQHDIAALLELGRDPFQMRLGMFRTILGGRRAAVKSILLNQKLISGMGNIYIDEALYRAGINPGAPAGAVAPRARDLLQAARRVLREAIRSGGTTVRDFRRVDGSDGYFQHELAVYGRTGEPCYRCGCAIEKTRVAGRGTHFCPVCQPPVRSREE